MAGLDLHGPEPEGVAEGFQGLDLGDALGLAALVVRASEFRQQRAGGGVHKLRTIQGQAQGRAPLGHVRGIAQDREVAEALVQQHLGRLERAVLTALRQHDVALQYLGPLAEALHPEGVVGVGQGSLLRQDVR